MKIIDVSDKYTYSTSHLPNSINIPYDELLNNYRVYYIIQLMLHPKKLYMALPLL